MKIEQLALWALLGISFAGVCSAQTYSGFEAPKDLGGLEGTSILYVRKENGSVLTAPRLPSQVGFSDVQLSPDRRRVGWVALMPSTSTSYPIPMRVVIFKGDKIERVIDGESCVFGWTFQNRGKDVAYFLETLHFSSGKMAMLREVASGKLLASYGLKRVDGDIPDGVLKHAPRWVREIPNIER